MCKKIVSILLRKLDRSLKEIIQLDNYYLFFYISKWQKKIFHLRYQALRKNYLKKRHRKLLEDLHQKQAKSGFKI